MLAAAIIRLAGQLWPLRLSADNDAAPYGGLAGEPQAGETLLAATVATGYPPVEADARPAGEATTFPELHRSA
jgi:hypothetical protein